LFPIITSGKRGPRNLATLRNKPNLPSQKGLRMRDNPNIVRCCERRRQRV